MDSVPTGGTGIKPVRERNIPHPGKVFYHGQWRSPEAVASYRSRTMPSRDRENQQEGKVFLWGWWRTPEAAERTRELELARSKAGRKTGYRKLMGDLCERCGFVPQISAQLDVHHKDGDHFNDDPDNLETICANCHRLEHAPAQRSALVA